VARFIETDGRFVFDVDIVGGGDGGDGGINENQLNQISNALSAASPDILDQVTIPPLAATANDLSLPEGLSFRLSTSGGAQIITGFANVKAGRQVFILNFGANNITLNNQDAGSLAQNRIITGTGAAVAIQPDRSALLVYDGTTVRWRLIAFT